MEYFSVKSKSKLINRIFSFACRICSSHARSRNDNYQVRFLRTQYVLLHCFVGKLEIGNSCAVERYYFRVSQTFNGHLRWLLFTDLCYQSDRLKSVLKTSLSSYFLTPNFVHKRVSFKFDNSAWNLLFLAPDFYARANMLCKVFVRTQNNSTYKYDWGL